MTKSKDDVDDEREAWASRMAVAERVSRHLPEVNELALRLAARVLRRDVDGMPLALPDPTHPADELRALARDIETFADLVVARLGSTRWELERAERQLRVQDGEIEDLQSKLDAAYRVAGQRAVTRGREDDTTPETPAARAAGQAFTCLEPTCDRRGLLTVSTADCERCGAPVKPFPGVVATPPAPESPPAAPPARYVCENEGCGYKGSRDVPQRPGSCPCCKCELAARAVCGAENSSGRVRWCELEPGHEGDHRAGPWGWQNKDVPPLAPENLAEAPAVRYECKNEGCIARKLADWADPGVCPACGNKLFPRS